MGLIGMMGRTAVITATANATANGMNRRRARRDVERAAQQPAAAQPQPVPHAAPAAAPAGPVSMDEKLAQIERLGQLKAQGILTDEEFAQQKATILAQ
jgi:hypothetical protein